MINSISSTKLKLSFYELIKGHPSQGRPALLLDPRLCKAARDHATDMVTRGYYGHTSPEGVGANHRAMRAGYPVPSWYHQHLDANNIESYYYGSGPWNSAEQAFNWFLNSQFHKGQLLADSSFTKAQTVVGVGYAIGGRGIGAYVFLSCHPFSLKQQTDIGTQLPRSASILTSM